MTRLNTWDLWGAVYVLLGGCSDDTFEYVRCWIVGRGRQAVEQACADAEGYVLRLLSGVEGDAELLAERMGDLALLDGEPLLYAVGTAHEQLTGEWGPPVDPARGRRPRTGWRPVGGG